MQFCTFPKFIWSSYMLSVRRASWAALSLPSKVSPTLCKASAVVRPLQASYCPGCCDLIKACWWPPMGWPPPATSSSPFPILPLNSKPLFAEPHNWELPSAPGNIYIHSSHLNVVSDVRWQKTRKGKEIIGNKSKGGRRGKPQSNLELWTEFETAFPDSAGRPAAQTSPASSSSLGGKPSYAQHKSSHIWRSKNLLLLDPFIYSVLIFWSVERVNKCSSAGCLSHKLLGKIFCNLPPRGKIRCLRVWRVQDWRMWRGGCVVVQMIAALTFCTLLHLRAAVHSAAPRVPPTYHSRPFTGLFCNSYSNIYYRSAVAPGLCKSTAFKLGAEILGARRRQWLREERIAVWSISQLPRNFVSLDMVYRRRSI